jgi:methylenetetrahydrofolate reductase (NADPH)
MNQGIYLDEDLAHSDPSDFCIGVAGYPEKHHQAANKKIDLQYTKFKMDLGADYIVTQMFFDNHYFKSYVEDCKKMGISIPIIPGLKIFTLKRHLEVLPRIFHTHIPNELASQVKHAKDEDIPTLGIKWAAKQTAELLDMGVPGIHFFVFSNEQLIDQLMEEIHTTTSL